MESRDSYEVGLTRWDGKVGLTRKERPDPQVSVLGIDYICCMQLIFWGQDELKLIPYYQEELYTQA